MAISELPVAPSRSSSPETFSDQADAFVAALSTFRTEANQLGTQTSDNSAQAVNASTSAMDSALISAANANFYGNYGSLSGALSVPASVRYTDNKIYILLVDLADVTSVVPGTDANTWYDYTSSVTGGTVVSSDVDTTSGRLTNTDWNYGRAAFGNAPVDQSANASFDIDDALPIYGTNYLVDRTVCAGTFPDVISGESDLSIIREELLYSGATVQKMYPYTDTTAQASVAASHTRYRTTTPAGVSAWVSSEPDSTASQFARLAQGGGSATYGGGGFTSATDVDNLYTMDFSDMAVGDQLEMQYICSMTSSSSGSQPTIALKIGAAVFSSLDVTSVSETNAYTSILYSVVISKTATTTVSITQRVSTTLAASNPRGSGSVSQSTNAIFNSSGQAITIRMSSAGSSRQVTRGTFSIDLVRAP